MSSPVRFEPLRQRAKATLYSNFGLRVHEIPEALIMAKMLQLEIKDLITTGHRRCRFCGVHLISGKNISPSRAAAGGLVCKTCLNFSRYGMPTRPDAVRRLKHRLLMREWARKKAADKRRRVSKNERSKNRKHR